MYAHILYDKIIKDVRTKDETIRRTTMTSINPRPTFSTLLCFLLAVVFYGLSGYLEA